MEFILFTVLLISFIQSGRVQSVLPSPYREWSEQRLILDFKLHENTSEVYVAATYLYHLTGDLREQEISALENNEITATNVIISSEQHIGLACSELTGKCFTFNLSDVTQFSTPSEFQIGNNIPFEDFALARVSLSGVASFAIGLAKSPGFPIFINSIPTFPNMVSVSPEKFFTGGSVTSNTPTRTYLTIYTHGDHIYYVVRHEMPQNSGSPAISLYLMRMCQDEPSMAGKIESIVEVELNSCNSSTNFPQTATVGRLDRSHLQVLAVTFTADKDATSSSLCVYTQSDIDNMIDATIQACSNGSPLFYSLSWTSGIQTECSIGAPDGPCRLCHGTSPCHVSDYSGINGIELIGYDVILYSKMTAHCMVTIDEIDLVFIGTVNGELLKYQLTNFTILNLIENIDLNQVLQTSFSKIIPDSRTEYLYASRDSLLYRVELIHCRAYQSCQSCVETIDPVCGYCSLSETCTRKSDCTNADLPLRWITDNSNTCLSLNSVTPMLAQVGELTQINVNVSNLPKLQSPHTFECVFEQHITNVTNISMSGSPLNLTGPNTPGIVSLSCHVPTNYILDNDYQRINFSLRSTELGLEFAEQVDGFTFHNCSFYSRCESCANSPAPCYWCLYDNLCTHSSSNCYLSYVVPENNSSFCPSITNTTDLSVHNGTNAVDVLELRTRHMPQPVGSYQYKCLYQINSMEIRLNGTWESVELLKCSPPPLIYTVEGTMVARIYLKWGLEEYNIEEELINVTIFNCEKFEQDCSSCFGFGGLFGCGLCNTSLSSDTTCRLKSQCGAGFKFTDPSNPFCPDPSIIMFTPKGGRTDGGTPVTISGDNFGGSQEALSVTVANVSCQITSYDIVGKTLTCITGQLLSTSSTGPVTVTVQGSQTATSNDTFQYLDPVVRTVQTYLHVDPLSDSTHADSVLRGVFVGGTLLEIIGANLGAGATISVDITENQLECNITNEDQVINTPGINFITCLTTDNMERIPSGIITVEIDGIRYLYQGGVFTYSELSISLSDTTVIAAGGIPLILTATDAQSLHRPELAVVDGNGVVVERKRCERVTETMDKKAGITCESPPTSNLEYSVEFQMDNLVVQLSSLRFVPNPSCTGEVEYSDSILIKGSNFTHVSGDFYSISINSSGRIVMCPLIRLDDDEIGCFPEEKITGILLVQIGRRHQCTFPNPIEPSFTFFERYGYITIGSSGGFLVILVIILVLIFIIVIWLYRYKKLREVEGIIDTYYKMESTLAKEFKTGFAELQVEIVEFVQAAETNDIPFTDFQDYILKLIFRRDQDVLFLTRPMNIGTLVSFKNIDHESGKKGMKLFQELLNNKEFLVEMVRVFDQNPSLDINQKSYFASLIMIAMHKNLFYATEILKALIDDLINKNKLQHQQLKTLFRGTSVCEKLLSNWLAFCLYNYLRGRPGEELYNLYSAIKLQIQKGPIDAITNEAKYSLNEDNILRMSFEVKEFEILCHFAENSDNVKLLDCDTITQVKRKIIDALNKNMSASQKPDPNTHELIFVKPRTHRIEIPDISPNRNSMDELKNLIKKDSGEGLVVKNPINTPGVETLAREIPTFSKIKQSYILLRDMDKTSAMESGWKRINTMRHYFNFYNIPIPQNGSLLLVRVSDIKDTFPGLHTDLMKRKSTETPPRIYHLHYPSNPESTAPRQKVISEVYYTKLLSTKGILQKYIDSMMDSIFPDRSVIEECPKPIKHLFDYLEGRARYYGITDAEVVQTWKNNSVVLRFWVNLLKNPDFILDIDVPVPVDSSLSTIAQGLIDSCSTREQELTKDSPANKLLFAKDTKIYKKRVKKYYEDIHYLNLPKYSFNQHLRQMQLTNSPFFVDSACQEIYMRWIAGSPVIRTKLITRLREKNLESQVTKFAQILGLMSDS